MQIVQINTPRLDRLSAILDGVAPVFSVMGPTESRSEVNEHGSKLQTQPSLVIAINPSIALEKSANQQATSRPPILWIGHLMHWTEMMAAQGSGLSELICLRARLTGPLGPLMMEEFVLPTVLCTNVDESALSSPLNLI